MAPNTLRHPLTTIGSFHPFLSLRRFSFFEHGAVSTYKYTLPCMEPSNDASSISQILISQHNPFHAMESSLQLNGISLSPTLLNQTLLRLRHNSKIALSLFSYSLSLPSPPVLSSSYAILIDILSKVRQFDSAWQLIVHMDQNDSVNVTPMAFFVLIRRLIAAGFTRQAIRAFDDMECFVNVRLDSADFCVLLDSLCKYGYVRVAAEVFNERKERFCPCVRMYTVLIYGWCKIGKVDVAEQFLREMIQRGIVPNVVTYNVILNGVCRRARLQPERRFERTIMLAKKVLDEMHKRGVELDVTSFSIVLHVYSRAHRPELVMEKLRLMRDKGISPSVATYTSAIKCLCSCGRMEDAEELLREMAGSGVSPSAVTYNCFFKEYRGRKDAEGALRLYRKMKEDGLCVPSGHTYNILLGMFVSLNCMDIVEEIWEDLKASGLGPDLDSYTLLVHGLCEKNKWREACQYFVEMIEKGLLPQKVTFEMLYRGLIQSDMLRTWRRLKKKLDEESIAFSSEFQRYHLKPYRR